MFLLDESKKNCKEKVVGKNVPCDPIASPVSTSFPHVFESQLFQGTNIMR